MFLTVVQLYRLLGRPSIEDDKILYHGICTPEIKACVAECKILHERYGSLVECEEEAGKIEVEFHLPASNIGRFHKDFKSFIAATPTLGKGIIPENFYIVKDDWSTTDSCSNSNYESVLSCCELIKGLCGLVTVVDSQSSSSHHNIFFALPADGNRKPKTFVLETKVDESILGLSLRHVRLVSLLVVATNENKIHPEERKLIFSTAIADVIEQAGDNTHVFSFLLKHWDEVLQKYWLNLQSYIHGFSFDKVRAELAKAELEYGSKLSAVLSDMAGKLLALPVSLAGVVLLNKATDTIEIASISAGILMVALIFWGVLWNQWLNIRRLNGSLDVTFEVFDKKLESYPVNLQKLLRKTRGEINAQRGFLIFTLWFFFLLAFLPTLGALVILYLKWPSEIDVVVLGIKNSVFSFFSVSSNLFSSYIGGSVVFYFGV